MDSKKDDNKRNAAKGKDTEQGNPSQQKTSAVTSGINVVAHGLIKAATSRASSATSSTPTTRSNDPPGPSTPIVEALKEKLPVFPSGTGSDITDPKFFSISNATGKSTKAASPPMAWIDDDMDSFLKTYFTEEIERISVPGMAPQLEESFRMSNEADVVRASAVYLLNVVNIAAQAWLGKKYGKKYVLKCAAEVHSVEKTATGTTETSADKADTGTIETRTDIEWRLETPADADPGPPKETRRVAVMEYKRKHLIDPKQLLEARYDKDNDKDLSRYKLEAPRMDGQSKTYFTDTAYWLIKQVKGYQQTRNVKDVCLFDWDTIFILNFEDGFDPDAQGSSKKGKDKGKTPQGVPAPKTDVDINKLWPAGILYREQAGSSETAAAEYTFRSLLLAFLIRALKRVTEPDKPLVPITDNESPPPPSHGEAGGKNPAHSETPAETTGDEKGPQEEELQQEDEGPQEEGPQEDEGA